MEIPTANCRHVHVLPRFQAKVTLLDEALRELEPAEVGQGAAGALDSTWSVLVWAILVLCAAAFCLALAYLACLRRGRTGGPRAPLLAKPSAQEEDLHVSVHSSQLLPHDSP